MDVDDLQLNIAVPEAPHFHATRTQQRRDKWQAQRQAKKQGHRRGQQQHGSGPSWPGKQQQPQQPAGEAGGSSGQLKGYSLSAPAPAAPAVQEAAPAKPQQQQQQQQKQKQRTHQQQARQEQPRPRHEEQQQDGGLSSGFRGGHAGRKPQPQFQSQPRQQQQAERHHQPQQRPQQDGQRPRGQQQQVVAQAQSGVELAQAHAARRQARHAPGGAAPRRRGGSPPRDAAEARRIGKLRAASRQAGYREPTPDLDEVKAAGSDAESEDVLAAVAAAVTRDQAVQQELAAAQVQRLSRYASESDDELQEIQQPQQRGKQQRADSGFKAWRLAAFAGSSDEEEGGGGDSPAGFVEFGGGDYAADPRPTKAQRRKDKDKERTGGSGGAAAKRAKGAPTVPVRPGELVHAGPAAEAAPGGAGADGASFGALGLSPQLAAHLAAHGFATPTPVQAQAIPVLLGGRDALVNAPTGSGKTLSYLAPIVHDLAAQQPHIGRAAGTHAIVVCPTRELCLQVNDVLTMLVRRFVWLVGGVVHGGEDRGKEKARLRKGVTVLVATPGRLLDHLENTQAFKTEALRWLVLDEADRLLDLGFEKKVAEMCTLLDQRCAALDYAQRRTTALLSATLHSNLGSLAALSLKDPAAIGFKLEQGADGELVVGAAAGHAAGAAEAAPAAGGGGAGQAAAVEQFRIPAQLRQRWVEVPCKLRLVALAALLRAQVSAAPAACKMVVFLSTTDSVEYYHAVFTGAWEPATGERLLQGHAAPILKLHGNMPQSERTAAFLAFTKAPAGVLLCTDVAARGLDFPAVTDIVQFDPPGEAAEYVHRVGRTARAGQRGSATLFLLPSERDYVAHLGAHGVSGMREQPATPLLNAVLGPDRRAGADLPLERHQGAYALQKQVMEAVAADRDLTALGGDAFRSWVRAYATHASAVKDIFHVRRLHLGHVAHAFALKERPTLVGKSATKAASQSKRKAQHGGGRPAKQARTQQQQQQGAGGKSGGKSKGGKTKVRRTHAAQVVSKGGAYNLA